MHSMHSKKYPNYDNEYNNELCWPWPASHFMHTYTLLLKLITVRLTTRYTTRPITRILRMSIFVSSCAFSACLLWAYPTSEINLYVGIAYVASVLFSCDTVG